MRNIAEDPNVSQENWRKVWVFTLVSVILLGLFILGWIAIYSLSDFLTMFLIAFLEFSPAFISNGLMPLLANIKGIPRFPLDGGRTHKDGQRVLGEGKSWNGLILGTIGSFLLGILIAHFIYPFVEDITIQNFADGVTTLKYITQDEILFIMRIWKNPAIFYPGLFLMCLGAPIGDLLGSYVKRRRGMSRGDLFLFWDQDDFLIGSILLSFWAFPIPWYQIIVLLLFTPLTTTLANIFAYYIEKKTVPY
jgi:CDP-2,3-bis-(O-geranylgeranyl)-sn-glycerol synthase